MSVTTERAESVAPARRPVWVDALHIFAVSGLAIAQPLFDITQKNATFFIAHGTHTIGVILFALALIILPPALIFCVLLPVWIVSKRLYRLLHAAVIGLLAGLIALAFVSSAQVRSLVSIVAFATVSIAVAFAYDRLATVRRYGTLLAIAPVVLTLLFLLFTPVRALVGVTGERGDGAGDAEASVPVVMLLMDEFSQGAILTPDGDIDERRFPNFARLAARSTWYPNATTSSTGTHVAVPTILTGRYARPGAPPVHASYRDNLFTLLGRSHRTSIDEWVTALCSLDACRDRAVVYSPKHLAADTALIYLHLILPPRVRTALPPLGHQWAGFFANPADNEQRLRQVPRAIRPPVRAVMDWLSDDAYTSLQVRRFDAFLRSIRREQQPRLSFLHVGLPHSPWHLLPDGTIYDRQHTPGLDRTELSWLNVDFANAALQRYALQVKGTDHLVGRLIDRLQDEDRWDDALVVVMADHGITFEAGRRTRAVIGTEGDVLPIPLFVKYPEQRRGRVDQRNAEIVDVLPTIADVVGVDVSWRTDGSSLAGPDPKRRNKRAWSGDRQLPPYDLSVMRTKTGISDRIRALFGSASKRDDLFGFGPHRDLVGRRIDRLRVSDRTTRITATIDEPSRWSHHDPAGPFVPARVTGTMRGGVGPTWLVVALNGRIAGFGKPWRSGTTWSYAAMVSPAYIESGSNDVELFLVDEGDDLVRVEAAG